MPSTPPDDAPPLSAEDQGRAHLYALLARMLLTPPGAADLRLIAALDAVGGAFEEPIADLARHARNMSADAVRREYDALFIGVVRGELLPYASYYLTGFLNEKPLAKLRATMADLGVARADDRVEPEDHLGSMCEIMAGLIDGAIVKSGTAPGDLTVQQAFFETHMEPWAGLAFADLAAAEAAVFLRPYWSYWPS